MAHWVRECVEMVQKKTGSPPVFKQWAGELGILKKAGYRPSQIKKHLAEYMYCTPIEWIRPWKFRATFNAWDPAFRRRIRIDKRLDRDQRAKQPPRREGGELERLKVEL